MSPLFAPKKNYGRIIGLSLFFLFSIVILNPKSNAQAVNETDSLALVALYNSTDGANWNINTNWLSGPVSTWYGITVSGDRVLKVELSGIYLNGTIPADIGDLTFITTLDLSSNALSGSIPAEIGNLTNLISLYFSSNSLTSAIPPEIGNLTSLSTLWLFTNNLSGSIPGEIGNLINLQSLHLEDNNLSGSIPSEIGNLSSLTELLINENGLTGSIPASIGSLINLGDFSVNDNSLSGDVPAEVLNLSALQTFDLSSNDFTGVPDFSTMNALNSCYISNNHIEFQDIENNISAGIQTFYYSPQKLVDTEENQTANIGEEVTFTTDVSGSANLYQWYKDGSILSGETDPNLTLSNITNDDAGVYACQISSEIVTDLTLTTYNKTLTVTDYNIESDSLALVALYNSTDGANWTDNTNWLTGPVSTWYGITVEGNRVSEIRLEGNSLTGTIPADLGNLSAATWMTLYQNALSGSIPAELGNMTNLEYLYLYENTLSGSIPPQLGNLANLIELNLATNELTGAIPSELGNLSNLSFLTLFTNTLSGNIPASLSNLSSLTYLNLANNTLDGNIPAGLESLSLLTEMRLENNSLSGTIPAELGNSTSLLHLILKQNEFSGSIPVELGNLAQLQELDLSENLLTGEIPVELCDLANLESLLLSNNQLTGSLPTEIGNLTNLSSLWLYSNQLSGSIPTEIGNLSNLGMLWLAHNQLSGSLPVQIGNLTAMNSFWLANNQFSGSIPAEIGNMTNANLISLSDNQLSGSIPAEIVALTNLKDLYLDNNGLSGNIPAELGYLLNLENIGFSNNDFIDAPDLSNFSSLSSYAIESNHIEFQDIEDFLSGGSSAAFTYTPQKLVDTEEYQVANPGNEVTFTTDISGTANLYQWFKDGSPLSGETAPNLVLSEIVNDDAGVYTCQITSEIVTDLTLTTYNKTLEVTDHTIVCGNISEYVTWSTDTVYVNCDVTIMDMAKVTINPGVRVLFAGPYKIRVEGCLQATGTAADSIWFSPVDTEEGWRGIEIETYSSSEETFFHYCVFEHGKAGYRSTQAYSGGALFIGSSMMEVSCKSCSFRNNYAEDDGGAIYATGTMVKIDRCSFCNNNCLGDGGAVLLGSNAYPITILNSLFANNESSGKGGGAWLELSGTGSVFYNNTFAKNNAAYGGGIYFYETSVDVYNSILYANASTQGGIQVGIETSSNAVPNFYYSDIQAGTIGFYLSGVSTYEGATSNLLDSDPLFTDPAAGPGIMYNGCLADYSLQETSPCINQGDPATSSSLIGDFDILGNNRFEGTSIDQGAYERGGTGSFFVDSQFQFPGLSNGNSVWLDYDDDGDLDIFYQGMQDGSPTTYLYENTGTTFTPTEVVIDALESADVTVCDYNLDNLPDLFYTGGMGSQNSVLYKNNGGSFTQVSGTNIMPLNGSAAAWADFDNDGDEDLAICGQDDSYGYHCIIYKNNIENFEVYDELFGLINPAVSWQDIDNDGDQDLLCIGDNGSGTHYAKLYRNDDGSFVEITNTITPLEYPTIDWADFNGDGYMDLITTGQNPNANTQIYLNTSGTGFSAYADGLPDISEGDACFSDFNSDGLVDVFLIGLEAVSGYPTQALYLNSGSGFDLEESGVLDMTQASVSVADVNQDGKPDMFVMGNDYDAYSMLYLNDSENANTPPSAPVSPTSNITGSDVELSWGAGDDAETPVVSLTYNLMLKDESGNLVQSPLATIANGHRKISGNGSNDLALTKTFSCLPAGTYYWRVQSIDQGFSASAFTEEASFEMPDAINIITQPSNAEVCENGDTLFGLVAEGANLTYQWQVNMEGWEDLQNDDVYQNVNSDTLRIIGATSDITETQYRCKITCDCPGEVFSDEVSLTVNGLPTVYNVTGGGSYCAGGTGVEIGLDGSETGVEYTLLLDGSPTSTIVSGTGTAISFGYQTAAGDYTVSAENTNTSCTSEMTGTVAISIDNNPTAFNVTGGGSYCAGGTGVEIGLDGSETGVEYTLVLDGTPTSTIVSGTGTAISFGDQTAAGDYTVTAENTTTSCTSEMTGTKSISIDDNPTAFNVTGGGSYCAGGTGVEIGLDGSETGVEYTLLLDGSPTSTIVSGTGTVISFGDQTTAGDYTVSALNTATSCSAEMSGTVAISIDDNPIAFNVTGGGSYCAGGTGVEIGLDGSETGVEYTLLLDGSPTSTIVSGTGTAISFGDQTAAGDYTVSALNTATSCSAEMSGTVAISIDDNPTAFNVTGGGSYCAGGTGVEIGLDGSETGVEYTLLLDGSPTSIIVSGTGTAISFGDQTAAGDYTVSALNTATSCSLEMTGTVAISIDDNPTAFTVTGGGSYCAGGTGVEIGLDGSETGVEYTLVLDGSPTSTIVSGTGTAISFGDQTAAGDYTVSALNTATSCSLEMTGTVAISIDDNPTAFTVTGGGSYCAGGTGVEIGLDGSETGVEYTLLLDGSPTSTIVSGTGTAISFGDQTAAGDYTVSALNTATYCSSEMTGTVAISIDDNPTAFTVTGGGSYCAGGAGVEIGLDGSETGVEYTLVLDGTPTSTIVSGTGTAISFGDQTAAGDYTVSALNTATSCSAEMTGTVAISIDDNPAAFNVTGGGSYCAGGTGVEIGLDGSETGVEYTLLLDGSPTSTIVSGTGTAISFGDQTAAGDYTVSALNTATSCSSEMTGTVAISIDNNPTAFNVTGGGSYCAGGTGVEIGLDGSETGVEYTLLLDGSPTSIIVSGTGTAISFGDQTAAGDYTVSALNTATYCSSEMTGTVAISIDNNPTAFTVTGGGSYCAGGAGVEIGLDGSETGVEYTLLLDGSPTSTIVSGTGTAISFGDQTAAGDYTVSALNTATSCSSEMTGTVAISIDNNPTAFNVTGGGSYCAGGTGVEIGLDGSETGVEYTLLLDSSPTSIIVSGTGTAISFGDQTAAGDYTVSALNTATYCSSEMTGTVAISIDDNPAAFNVSGGGSYCAGGTGVEIGLDGSETGVEYTLLLDGSPTSNIVSGTGTAISFGDQTAAGDYTVSALNTATSCSSEMTGTVAISIDDNPTAFNVTGGGNYCAGGTGVEIGLDGSETGVEYTLLLDGSPTSTIVSGTGTVISFGDQTTAGDYTVSALNTATSCSAEMSGTVAISIDDNPIAFNVTGGGSYCAGGTGVEIGLDGSETGVEYTLLLDGSPTSTIVSGTGTAISFGDQTAAGDYTVSALNTATSCSAEMTGTVAISIDDNPTAFNVTGGGSYCAGGTGVEIGLDGSETGVEYTLVLDGSPTSTIVSGTGTAISFGDQTAAGDYTVSALNTATSCSSEMTGTVAISIDDNPTAFNVTGGGSYCAGGTGVEIGLDGSETGVEYTLLLDGSPTSTIVSGTGTAISFGDQTAAGDYTVSALNTATSCSSEMTGTVAISIDDNPTAFNVTGGGSYCAGGMGVEIGLDGSETGVEYTLLLDGSPTSTIVSGTGTAISFGDQTAAGDYTVSALNTATSCSSEMTGTVAISIDDNPTAFTVTGGGSYCAGGTGVEIGLDGSETGVEYTLLLDGSPTSTIVSGTGTAISFGDQTAAGDYTVSALNTATSCSSEMTGTVAISIDDNPTAFNVTGGGSYCAGGTGVEIGLDGSETGVEYTLLLDGSPTSTIVSGTGTVISFGDQTTAGDYTVSALNTATSCSSEMTGTVAVIIEPLPDVSFSGLANTYCSNDDPALLTGNQAPEGSFTGSGITDNGDGTAWFDPSVAGTGFHNIEYSYTSPTGCGNQQTSTTEVLEIPLVEFTGLDAAYCENASAVLLTGNQVPEGIFSGNGITDNGDGTAWFDPAVAGVGGPYSISYSYTNPDGCSDEDMQEVTVNALPIISFTGLDASNCQDNDDVLLSGSEAPEGSFTGDGITDNGDGTATLSFVALMPDVDYQIVYSYTDGNGCTGTDIQTWHLNAAPTADFSYDGACFNQEVEFTDLSLANAGNIVSWEWDFDDGNISTEQNPVHQFESGTGPGFDVQLTVVNNLGCSNTLMQHIVISDPPEAGFTYDVDPPCAGNEVLFTDNSIPGSGSITNWMWDLGDGNSTNGQSFTHIYENAGLYTVELIVLSNTGCSDTITQDVEIHALPDADFDFTNGCPDQMLDFTDLSSITQGSIASWEWDFGDGNTSADQNAQHAYTAPGNYNVALKVTSDQGCEHSVTKPLEIYTLPDADFSFGSACSGDDVTFTDQSTGGNYNLVSWMWDFGDGSTSTDQNPVHVFENPGQYDVTLTVSHEFGCSDTKLISVDVHPTPIAAFSWEGVCANHTFAFTDESDPAGGNLISWTWDFGDGTSSTEQNPQHNWPEAGSYDVRLTVSSEEACSSTILQTVNVGYVPQASFTFQGVCAGNPTVFTDMSSVQQGEISSWMWDFDDGITSGEQNPEHVFTNEGFFNVWLKVAASNSCIDSVQEVVQINLIPDLNLGNDTTVCPGGFYLDAGGSYSSYIWSTGANTPGILIEESGWYKLAVEDEFGCGATDSVYVSVLEELQLQGRITTAEEVVNSGFVYLYRYEENAASEKIDSTLIEYGGFYEFFGLNPCDRFIIMAEGDPMFYPDNYPTYYDDVAHWEEATIIDSTFASVDGVISDIDIQLMQYENMGQGSGYLQGFVFYSDGGGGFKGHEERGEPVKNTDISLEMLAEDQKSTDADVFHTTRRTKTDKEGFYMFNFLPTGTFRIVVEIPGLPLDSMYRLTITDTDSIFLDLNYYVDTTSGIYVTPDPSGVEDFVAQQLQLAVRPNPNKGNFALFFLEEQHQDVWVEEVQIMDMTGSIILHERLGKACRRQIADMHLHDVLPGLYLLNLQTDKGRMMVKMIVR